MEHNECEACIQGCKDFVNWMDKASAAMNRFMEVLRPIVTERQEMKLMEAIKMFDGIRSEIDNK